MHDFEEPRHLLFKKYDYMIAATLIFPHQLFAAHPGIKPERDVYLIEECLFFTQYSFHRQKLILHRASMKIYAHQLNEQNITVRYIDCNNGLSDIRKLIKHLAEQTVTEVHIADVADHWLKERIASCCRKHRIDLFETVSPNLLNTLDGVKSFFDKRKTYFQTAFYIEQRTAQAARHIVGCKGTAVRRSMEF